jgi:flagellar basal-body rod protein FlgC
MALTAESAPSDRPRSFRLGEWLVSPPECSLSGSAGVRVNGITEDQTPGRRVHDPKHPQADADGYVTYSNVNPAEEMVNMISASRSYQNNIEVMSTAKSPMLMTHPLGLG